MLACTLDQHQCPRPRRPVLRRGPFLLIRIYPRPAARETQKRPARGKGKTSTADPDHARLSGDFPTAKAGKCAKRSTTAPPLAPRGNCANSFRRNG